MAGAHRGRRAYARRGRDVVRLGHARNDVAAERRAGDEPSENRDHSGHRPIHGGPPEHKSRAAAHFSMATSVGVPPEMRFLSATFPPAPPAVAGPYAGRGEVRGIVSGRTPAEAQSRVNAFLAAVRAQPGIGEPGYTVFEVRPRGGDGGGYEQEFLLGFALRER